MSRSSSLAATIGGTLALLAIAAPAAAEDLHGRRQAVVNYGDLDISKPADAARLERRLASAARRVCDNSMSRMERGRDIRCRSDALARARAEVFGTARGTVTAAGD